MTTTFEHKDSVPLQTTSNASLEELAARYRMEVVKTVSDDMFDHSLVANLSVEWARSNCLLPVRIKGQPCVLTADPTQVHQCEYLTLLTGSELKPVLAPQEIIMQGIERCYYSKTDSPGDFLRDLGASGSAEPEKDIKSYDLLQVAEKAPVTTLINLIMLAAVKRRASDIHIEPFESRLRLRYRIDGVLYDQDSPPKHLEDAIVSRLKIMAHMDIAEKRLPQDGMARVRVGEREIDIRVSTVPVAEGERVVLRLLDRDSALLPLTVLGMSESVLDAFQKLLSEPNGMIIVSGPTGSGKTTTLYAALGRLDAERKNIMTIEEPIEYQLPDIGQIQVKPKIGLTFASGLRHILRQDPDIVLVGETRDLETAEIAVRASLTGHLVFTTLHTNDAAGAVVRLTDIGIEPYLLASCLRGILAQRLVRRLCPKCKAAKTPAPAELEILGSAAQRIAGKTVWGAVGCPSCIEGYSGRIGLFELIVFNREMQDCLRLGQVAAGNLRTIAGREGMGTLLDDGLQKVLDGKTTIAEVLTTANPH
jgi:general secretion pathway protein E